MQNPSAKPSAAAVLDFQIKSSVVGVFSARQACARGLWGLKCHAQRLFWCVGFARRWVGDGNTLKVGFHAPPA
jgi:hypothetical protein